jgi:pimeloyl-ACP methyl ester carboxylesterase
VPVARRLVEQGCRVVIYDQRGHGASTRGAAPLSIETLAHDFALVLETLDAHDAVLAGHSMGGITIMSLATHRLEVLNERTRAIVLVSTTATGAGPGSGSGSGTGSGDRSTRYARSAGAFIGSPLVTRALRAPRGHLLVRGAFGREAVRSHLVLTRDLFAGCDGSVRGEFLSSMASMNLLEGIAALDVPTTVVVGSRDTLTVPMKSDEIVATVRGSRLLTLRGRGHMLPLEDPVAVTDEIVRAVKG